MTEDSHHQPTDDDPWPSPGESLEFSVVEIKEMLYLDESAWSGIEIAAPKVLSKELGVDPDWTFWVASPLVTKAYGIDWEDDEGEIANLEPPPDQTPGWKLHTKYPNPIRYWWGNKWDLRHGRPRYIHTYRRIAAGDDIEPPEPPRVNLDRTD